MNSLEAIWKHLTEPSESLFFSRGDESDPRMGDLVLHGKEEFTAKVQVGILGVPEDEGVKRNRGRVGAKDAPNEIRKALYKFTPFAISKEKSCAGLSVFDFGNVKTGSTLEQTHETLQEIVESVMAKNIVLIVLGGGHDIAYPNFLGFSRKGMSAGVINIDTHLDYRKPHPHRNSGTSFRQILDHQRSALSPMNFVEIGTQSFANAREHYDELLERGATIFPLREVREEGLSKLLDLAYEIATNSTDRLYISFDMDAVRSNDAPGVSASYPTGLTAEEFLSAALFAGKRQKTKIIDVVEVNPKYDIDGRTSKLAALAIMYFLTGVANR